MKKALSILLAVLLLCGAGAVGSNAFVLPGMAAAQSIEAESVASPVSLAGYDELTPEEKQEIDVIIEKSMWFFILIEVLILSPLDTALSADPALALKDAAKVEEYEERISQAVDAVKDAPATLALRSFLDDEDAIVAAYKDGTLKTRLQAMLEAVMVVWNASMELVCREYLKPECYDFMTSWLEWVSLEYLLLVNDPPDDEELKELIGEALWEELEAAMDGFSAAVLELVKEGKWDEAKALVDRLTAIWKIVAEELGLLTPPGDTGDTGETGETGDTGETGETGETGKTEKPADPDKIHDFFARFLPEAIAGVMTWVVRYLFFGWLWGRWL